MANSAGIAFCYQLLFNSIWSKTDRVHTESGKPGKPGK